MDVQHELNQGVFESRAVALQEIKPPAGDFRTPREIENFEFLAQIVVWRNVVGKLPEVVEPLTPALDVFGLVVAHWDRVVRQLWQRQQGGFELGLQLVGSGFDLL